MNIKIDKLTKIQSIVTNIKDEQNKHVVKTTVRTKRFHEPNHNRTESHQILPIAKLVIDDTLDPLMLNIRNLLDKCHKPKPMRQLITLLSPQKAQQIYGSKRLQIESRWKEIYEEKKRNRLISPSTTTDVTIAEDATNKSQRLLLYQQRIGLVKKKDTVAEMMEQIAHKHHIHNRRRF